MGWITPAMLDKPPPYHHGGPTPPRGGSTSLGRHGAHGVVERKRNALWALVGGPT